MASKFELLIEAEKRGLLKPGQQALLDEARKRGIVAHGVLHPDDMPADNPKDAQGREIIPDTDQRAGLPLPGTVSQAEANGEVKNSGQQHFGLGSSDTLNPLPAIAAGADAAVGALPGGKYLQGLRDDASAWAHGDTPDAARADISETKRQNPDAVAIGTVAGKAAPFVAASANPVTAGALGLEGAIGMRFLMGGLSSEAINFGDEMSKGKDPLTAATDATKTTVAGLPFYAAGRAGGKAEAIAAAPTVADLKSQAGKLYDAAEKTGVVFSQPSAEAFINSTTSKAMKGGLDETLTPGAVSVVKRMQTMTGRNMSIEDAMLLRKLAGNAADAAEAGSPDQRMATLLLKDIDSFLEGTTKSGPGGLQNMAVLKGDAKAANDALKTANQTYSAAMKAQTINRAIETAVSRADSSRGQPLEQAIRNEFGKIDRAIIAGEEKGFTPAEIKMIRDVAKGGGAQAIARYIGKLSPTGVISGGVGSGVGMGIAAALGHGGDPLVALPAVGGVMALGKVARDTASTLSKQKADYTSATMRLGAPNVLGPTPSSPVLSAVPASVARAVTTMTLGDWQKQQQPALAGQ